MAQAGEVAGTERGAADVVPVHQLAAVVDVVEPQHVPELVHDDRLSLGHVALVGVLVRDSKDQGEIYAKQEGLTYPSLYDPKTQVALQFRNYPIVAIPSTIVFDKKGEVAAAYVSTVDAKSLTKTLDQLLAEK